MLRPHQLMSLQNRLFPQSLRRRGGNPVCAFFSCLPVRPSAWPSSNTPCFWISSLPLQLGNLLYSEIPGAPTWSRRRNWASDPHCWQAQGSNPPGLVGAKCTVEVWFTEFPEEGYTASWQGLTVCPGQGIPLLLAGNKQPATSLLFLPGWYLELEMIQGSGEREKKAGTELLVTKIRLWLGSSAS